jgi:surfeit locus 1 family protein
MVHYRSLIPPLVAMAAVVLFARLGMWQLQRADDAKVLQATVAARTQAKPLLLDAASLAGDVAALHWRPVEVRGVWSGDRQILLDNQISHGEAGYFVYTPLRVRGCDCAVLVNRGWLPAGPRRDVVPDVGTVAGAASIRGTAAPAPASGFGMRPTPGEAMGSDVLRVQRLDPVQLSDWCGVRVLPLTILLAPDAPDGFRREWRPPDPHADRHIAYAVQWFLFGLIAAGLAIRLNSARS